MKKVEEICFATIILVVFIVFVAVGWGYSDIPRTVPLVLSIPGVLTTAALLILMLKKRNIQTDGLEELKHKGGNGKKILTAWSWVVAFAVAANFVGIMIATPFFLFAFLVSFARRPWVTSLVISALFTTCVYLIFVVGLKTQL